MKRNQKVEDYIESRLDELQERFRKLYKDTDRAAQSMLIRELRHIKTMITIEEAEWHRNVCREDTDWVEDED